MQSLSQASFRLIYYISSVALRLKMYIQFKRQLHFAKHIQYEMIVIELGKKNM